MKKKLVLGALALSATAVLGLTGCGDKKTYTVTFDSDPAITSDNKYVDFKEGATKLENVPTPVEKDGFAGVWESFKLEDKDITVTAKYGDGTAANPYMVATASQFKTLLTNYTYAKAELPQTQTYFKLIADVDLDDIADLEELELASKYFNGVIDGDGHKLLNLDGSRLRATEGALFANITGATIKNLNVYLGKYLGTIAGVVRGGTNEFNNVKVYNEDRFDACIIKADDNNESAFINFVLGDDTVMNFKNCINNADYVGYAQYNGLLVGGYATANTTVNFDGCVNNGEIVSVGAMGMFFGNSSHKPASYSITNCVFNGSLEVPNPYKSHVLCADSGGSAFASEMGNYDTNIPGQLAGVNAESIELLESKYTATINGDDIEVSASLVEAGKYQLVLSSLATTHLANSKTGNVLTNIVVEIEKTLNNSTPVKFENVYYGMIDLNTFNQDKQDADKVVSSYSEGYEAVAGIEWKQMEGYNIRYAIIDGTYVIDYTQYDIDMGHASATTINKTAASLTKGIAVTDTDEDEIEFIVNFQ